MQIALGLGLGLSIAPPAGPPPLAAPGLTLTISPAAPVPGDLVTVSGIASGNPAPVGFATISVTIGGTAVLLTGEGLTRRFIARSGALAISAGVGTGEGTASATLSEVITPGVAVASVAGFGSSTMEGDGASATAARALNLIAGVMGTGVIRNRGTAGTVLQNSPDASGSPRSGNGRDRFESALLGANRSARLYVLYGANDLRYTAAPATFNVEGFQTDLREVMNGLIVGGYAREEIVIGSPNWYPDATYSVGSAGFTGSNRAIHESYVNACVEMAGEYGVAYADVYGKMRDMGGTALMSADGLHCNDAGHQVIAHAFLSATPVNARAVSLPGTAISEASGALALTWAAVPGAIGYRVETGLAGTHGYPLTQTVTQTTHMFSALANGSYLARVRAEFADGAGPWSFWTTPVAVTDGTTPLRTVTGEAVFAGQAASTLIADVVPVSGTLLRHPLSTGQASISADGAGLRGPGSTNQFCIATLDEQPLGSGVFVELDFLVRSNSAQLTTYAVARANAASLTFLAAGYNGSAWRILKYVNGAATVLGSHSQTETVGATPVMRFEVAEAVQRLYRNDILVLTTTEPDSGLGTPGEGIGLRIGAGTTAWTSANGGQVTAMRVGRVPA